jgi:hypothetical protein
MWPSAVVWKSLLEPRRIAKKYEVLIASFTPTCSWTQSASVPNIILSKKIFLLFPEHLAQFPKIVVLVTEGYVRLNYNHPSLVTCSIWANKILVSVYFLLPKLNPVRYLLSFVFQFWQTKDVS